MPEFGDYIVYVDESGDHSLSAINPEYPIFVLAFCIFPIASYAGQVVPAIENFKFKYFGHDMVILHETEIRKRTPPFEILNNQKLRNEFLGDLDSIIHQAPFSVVASIIDKLKYKEQGREDTNPYHVALEHGLERVFLHLQALGQRGKKTRLIFESRGLKEDIDLELEFRRILDRTHMQGMADSLEFLCVSKKSNSSGLQFADMIARPIGLAVLRPEQANKAWETIKPKLRASKTGDIRGFGLKIFP